MLYIKTWVIVKRLHFLKYYDHFSYSTLNLKPIGDMMRVVVIFCVCWEVHIGELTEATWQYLIMHFQYIGIYGKEKSEFGEVFEERLPCLLYIFSKPPTLAWLPTYSNWNKELHVGGTLHGSVIRIRCVFYPAHSLLIGVIFQNSR